MLFGYFTLIVALIIETVGAYYSITGLAAIFSGAVIPILIMGASLEVGKVTAAVWLKLNWDRANLAYKLYLVPAVAFLMLLTSMGIFGFLSKAHSDQNLVSGDSMARVAIYDEKIKTEKENIEANRKALKQMDEGVDQVLGRSTDEKGADKAVALRRAQQKERVRLQNEILQSQKSIAELNDARAPLAAEVRKVENEVGPIKYIAALIYGDNPDANILERAVRWVIILIVAVFDPLALVLILAAQQSLRWARDGRGEEHTPVEVNKHTQAEQSAGEPPAKPEPSVLEQHPYLLKPFAHFKDTKPMVQQPEPAYEPDDGPLSADQIEQIKDSVRNDDVAAMSISTFVPGVTTRNFTPEEIAALDGVETRPLKEVIEEYVDPNTRIRTLVHKLVPDNDAVLTSSDFGLAFPVAPNKGDSFIRVDSMPHKLYKYNGRKWMEIDKTTTDSYISEEYSRYLISRIRTGEYNIDDLTDSEVDYLREYLKRI